MRLVIAVGGNALLHRGEVPDITTQTTRLAAVAPTLARLAEAHEVILVHGNGPQIGVLARESTEDCTLSAPYPLTALGAATQGIIGSLIQQALHNAGSRKPIVTLVSHTIVEADDPAMRTPTKFIGAVYTARKAHQLAAEHGWHIGADGAGWRRIVPSPRPRHIVELKSAVTLLRAGVTVIMGGGGGVPLTENPDYRPVDAVIDKDHVASLIGREWGAELLVILTDVPGVIAHFATPDHRVIRNTTSEELRALQLPAGSMGPKVEAACAFVDFTGRRAAIGALETAEAVVAGTAGTQILAASNPAV